MKFDSTTIKNFIQIKKQLEIDLINELKNHMTKVLNKVPYLLGIKLLIVNEYDDEGYNVVIEQLMIKLNSNEPTFNHHSVPILFTSYKESLQKEIDKTTTSTWSKNFYTKQLNEAKQATPDQYFNILFDNLDLHETDKHNSWLIVPTLGQIDEAFLTDLIIDNKSLKIVHDLATFIQSIHTDILQIFNVDEDESQQIVVEK